MVLGPLMLAGFGYLIVRLAGRNTKRQRRLIEESDPVNAVIILARPPTSNTGGRNFVKIFDTPGVSKLLTGFRPSVQG